MFKYNYVGDLFRRLMESTEFPMQVEFHPGHDCGPLHCRFCYGKFQKVNDGLLTIENYNDIIDQIVGKTRLIDISGIASDPLSYLHIYELIELIKNKGIHFGLHTKGFYLTKEISTLLNYGRTSGDFITLSIDSVNSTTYNYLHGVHEKEKALEHVLEQIKYLKSEKDRTNSNLRINVGYLLFQKNSSEEEIEKFIEIFEPLADVLRFSIPQVPNVAKPVGYIPNDEIVSKLEMLKKYEKDNIVVLKFDYSEHDKSFNTCWSQRFNITIDKAGFVFPCPQVATSAYNHISYGNIKESQIWEIWNSKRRNKILNMHVDQEMRCRVCDRKDENINIELEKILKPKKYI